MAIDLSVFEKAEKILINYVQSFSPKYIFLQYHTVGGEAL